MNRLALHRLLCEWATLIAILAFALAPLALAVGRGLSAEEQVLVASGAAPLPICQPGDTIDDLGRKTGGGACDHCVVPDVWKPAAIVASSELFKTKAGSLAFAPTPRAHPTALALPPSTGPPLA
ncbi:MAG: hypothetical protein ACRC7G_07075 [Beijerinckiaceae bacterium]